MADDEILTDDYVASLLVRDAKESSIKYSALGLEAFNKSKPPANKPKPNTRFLRNIIKDTDNHNAALLAKEASESKARLAGLSTNEHREEKAARLDGGDIRRRQLGDIASILGGQNNKRKRARESTRSDNGSQRVNASNEGDESKVVRESIPEPNPETESRKREGDIRKRQLGDIAAILGGRSNKRRRADDDDHKVKKLRHVNERDEGHSTVKNGELRSRNWPSKYDGSDEAIKSRSHKSDRRKERSLSGEDDRDEHRRRRRNESEERSHKEHRRRRSRSHSPREYRNKRERRGRERFPVHRRSISPEKSHRSAQGRSHSPEPKESEKQPGSSRKGKPRVDYDSDPLDDIIGPRPPTPVRARGRGAMSHGPGIDSRFSASYDPTVDVQLDPEEENDWDQALEALRDRQKWKQQGADRLRAAGFTEEEITKWEKGGEKREEDVKWTKQGESREWDRGKVINGDGIVSHEPSWGRLKGT
ncbi:hypothetical protein B0O99DRAFT_197047 [Bisporella sp. PMI_857]|nr:hypothetical protein B0O99DRAFT_197047 [Bisporella sp. PMI_857]